MSGPSGSRHSGASPAARDEQGAEAGVPIVRVYLLGDFRVVVRGRPVAEEAWRRRAKGAQLFKALPYLLTDLRV